MSTPLVPTKEVDYLDEDKPIRGQNFALVSFVSPEDVLNKKEVFYFDKFLTDFSKNLVTLYQTLVEKYPEDKEIFAQVKENHSYLFDSKELQEQYRFFLSQNTETLDKEFLESNDFQTCVRGFKIRGVFDTMKEAQVRADVLKRMGDKFDIFVAQVGCWCPWSPNPESLSDQEYAETQLNTLMKKYKENMTLRDELFQQRKDEKVQRATEASTSEVIETLEKGDTWSASKDGNTDN